EDTAPCSSMHSLTTTSAELPKAPLTLIVGMVPDRLDTAVADTTGVTFGAAGAGGVAGLGAARGGSAGGCSTCGGVAGGGATGGLAAGAAGGGSSGVVDAGSGSCAAPRPPGGSRSATRAPDAGCFLRSARPPCSAAVDGSMDAAATVVAGLAGGTEADA